MDSKQLLDSLADHLALYHTTPTTAKSHFRQKIIQWISSLTTEQRQAALTVVDESWIAILLQMQKRIQTDGKGFFIVLPDVPVSNSKAKPSVLPSLCYRKAKGLLARVDSLNKAEQVLSEGLRFFSSEEGEGSAVTASAPPRGLDSVTACEDLVKDLDRFIAVMDTISNGEFLNTTAPSSAFSWEELPWLKAKGYYSLSAFVANKLELALKLSWLNCHDKKRTSRMNSSAGGHQSYKNGRAAAGFASNVFWRKKGCVDWWSKVDGATKAKAFKVAVVKATKFKVKQLVGGSKNLLKTEIHSNSLGNQAVYAAKFSALHKIISLEKNSFCDSDFSYHASSSLCENPGCGPCFLSGLHVLQQVSALGLLHMSEVPKNDNLFFSTLSSVHTVLDGVMRRVRDILAKVSKDSVELDLLGDENVGDQLNRCKAKDAEERGKDKRRKGRSRKKKISMTKTPIDDALPNEQLCLEQKQRVMTEEDNGRGSIGLQRGPGTNQSKPTKEPVQSLICQEESITNLSSLQTDSVREQLISGCSEGQVNDNKQGRHRSNSKSKDTRNLNAAHLSDDIERQLGNGCDESVQYAASFSLEKKTDNLPQCINSNCTYDVSREDFCSQHVNDHISVHGINDNDYCDEGLVKHCETMIRKELLPKTTFQDDGGSLNGSTYKKPSEVPTGISHLPHKSDASDIKDSDLQNTISSSLNLTDTDMGDANILLRDCGNCSSLAQTSCDNYFDGRILSSVVDSTNQLQGHGNSNKELGCNILGYSVKPDTHALLQAGARNSVETPACAPSRQEPQQLQRSRTQESYIQETMNFMPPTSYEWPSSLHFRLPAANAQLLPATTDRLHLDGDLGWRHQVQPPVVPFRYPRVRQQSGHGGYHKQNAHVPATAKIIDWSPAIQTGFNLTPPVGYLFESGFIPVVQPAIQAGCTTSGMELNGHRITKEDAKYELTDDMDYDDLKYLSGDIDDFEGHVISEDEADKISLENQCNGADYNQLFGGGVMYWNTADYAGTGYSRPPSLSSEDSSWARHEADLNVVIDDLIALPQLPGPYGNSGVASPPTSFHSSFDQLGTGTPTTPVGFVKPGNDFSGQIFSPSPAGSASAAEEQDNGSAVKCALGIIEGMKGEALPCPILRPIVIPNVSRKGTRNEFACHQESRSPCVPCNRRETPRMKRPPSPVVLCVPPAPPPPPPSPVGAFRKQRGFPTVRSGSSSPRHWGISSWVNEEEMGHNDSHVCTTSPEVVGFTWKSKCITGTPPIHPLPSALLRERLISIPQLALEQEHPDIALPLQSVILQNNPSLQASLTSLHNLLHEEIEHFCKQVAAENLMRKSFVNAAVKRVARSLQVLWPRSRTKIFGSNATGLALPTSDVDLVVCLPPVRNLEPIKEAGILEGRNGIKETCLQHAARYLADQEWVKSDSLKTIENTAIPIIILVVKVHSEHCGGNQDCCKSHALRNGPVQNQAGENVHTTADLANLLGSIRSDTSACKTTKSLWGSKNDHELVRLDISFESSSHTGLQTAELVRALTGQFPAIVPLALVLKQFLTDRSLDHPYSGGLSSYCLVLLITRFLQHQHNTGRSINQNLGSLFMDFLYFFGCVFDPRQMRVSIRGSGMYANRDRGQSIDPLHIDDPLHQANNVGRNCFRIHQCIKAFADAHSILERELLRLSGAAGGSERGSGGLLQKIIPGVVDVYEEKAKKANF